MNRPVIRNYPGQSRQRGLALMISLIFLVVITLLALAAVNTGTLQERMMYGQRENSISLQAAESAVAYAEGWLGRPTTSAADLPVCDYINNPTPCGTDFPVWRRVPANELTNPAFAWQTRAHQFGSNPVTLAVEMPNYPVTTGVAANPRVVIALVSTAFVETAVTSDSLKKPNANDKYLYRITAWGTGRFTDAANNPSVTSLVETLYVKR